MDRGIVREHDRKRFTGILRAASGWNHSVVLRLVIVAVIVLFGHDFWKHELASRQLTAWYDGNGTSGITLTLAGYWFVWISNPVFQYLHLLWILRLLMFAAMLARIAALDLHLVATHPDHAGGMGFLGEKLYGFTELVIAEGTAVAGVLANRIIHEGRPLTQFKVDIAIVTVIVSAMVLGPMCVFIPRLLKVKRQGSSEYAELSNHYVREFEEAWVFGKAKAEGRELLGANDVQSLADMANSFNVVTRMRTTPFSNRQAINPMVCFLLPIAPLLLTVFPLEELLVKLIKAFTT
jgi:hypothetical protein